MLLRYTVLLLSFSLLLLAPSLHAQTGGVGVGTTIPDASAALDVVSSSKGALLPRLTAAARLGMGAGTVAAPAPGLIVYQTDAPTSGTGAGTQAGFWYNGGTAAVPKWTRLADSIPLSYDPATGLQVGTPPVVVTSGLTSFSGNGPSPYYGEGSGGQRLQYLFRAADLVAAGLQAGPIAAISFVVSTKNSSQPVQNFTLRLANTTATTAASPFLTTGLTTVYAATYSTVVGLNTHVFSTPFAWDGTSNLYLEACTPFGNSNDDNVAITTKTYQGVFGYYGAGAGCGLAGGTTSSANTLPVVQFSTGTGYTLPATGGSLGQVLTQVTGGAVAFQNPQWTQVGNNLVPTVPASNLLLGPNGGSATGAGQAVEFVGPGFNTDPVGLYRQNTATNASELRAVIGNDLLTSTGQDRFVVGTSSATVPGVLPGSSFVPRFTVLTTGAVVYSVQTVTPTTGATTIVPAAALLKYADNSSTAANGAITLSTAGALEGQQQLVSNLDSQQLRVGYSGGFISISQNTTVRFVLLNGGWTREI